jgi:uroporphyrinogen III methyltransferase/synthase
VELVEMVSHAIEAIDPPQEAFAAPARLTVFTSQAAVERVAGDPRLSALLARTPPDGQIAAVGPATAEALRSRGIAPDLVAAGSGEDILHRLPPRLDGWLVRHPCGEDAAEDLAEGLRGRGARLERVAVYRKVARPRDGNLDRTILDDPFAAFCATSPSAARWLFEGLPPAAADRLRATPAVALGPSTRRELGALGVARVELSDEPLFSSARALLVRLATAAGAA